MIEELIPPPDPAACCERLLGLPYLLFLDSALHQTRLGRYSFLAADPVAVIRSKDGRTEHHDLVSGAVTESGKDPLDELRSLLKPHIGPASPALPPFQGGAAGYVAYDWGRALERLPRCQYDDLALPDVLFGIYDWVLAWDHESNRAWLISTGIPETQPEIRHRRAA